MLTNRQNGDRNILRDHAIILLMAVIAVLPLLLRGASCGHDIDFHLNSWMEASEQWWHGVWWPRWDFTAAWGAGEPRFVFYPPLSWMLGGLLTIVFPIAFVPAIFTWVALSAAGITMRRFAAEWTSGPCALLAAVFYLVNPYMLFCAYERCAYGELLAAAWMPLLLHAMLREAPSMRRVALPVALLWLTNAPAAVMSCYLAALIAIFRIILILRSAYRERHLQAILPFTLRALGGFLLGLGLAAFYLVPAIWQRRWVSVEQLLVPYYRIQDNTLFHHTPDPAHDAVLALASRIALLLLALALVFFWQAWRRHAPTERRILAIAGAAAASIGFALTPLSLPFWMHLPQLSFLQFPWRMLALLGALTALLLALAMHGRRRLMLVTAVLIPLAIVPFAYRGFRQNCFDQDSPNDQLVNFHAGDGVDASDEYTPLTASNDNLVDDVNPWWTTTDPQSLSRHSSRLNGSIDFNYAQSMHIPAPHPAYLVVRLRNYPAWRVLVNGAPAQLIPRDDGYIALALPAQATDVSIRYRVMPDEIIGWLISLISLAVFLWLSRRARLLGLNTLTIPVLETSFMPGALPT